MKFNNIEFDTYFKSYTDENDYFGECGGSYIPPELQIAMNEISKVYQTICNRAISSASFAVSARSSRPKRPPFCIP